MPFTLTMPKLSPTMEEGVIAKWNKKEGELVEAGEVLFEVSTDKATVEHQALDSGWLRKILVKEGENAKINQPVAIFTEQKGESIEGYKPEGIAPEPVPAAAEASPSIAAQKTEKPKEGALPSAGTMQQPSFAPEAPLETETFSFPTEKVGKRIAASPLARKLAKEKGLDLSSVKGSGPHERIMSRDLTLAQPAGTVSFGQRTQSQEVAGSFEEETLSPMRKVIAQRLQESKTFIPHFYVSLDLDAEPMVQLREQLKAGKVKVTFNDLMIRACALALREHPEVNSGFYGAKQSIIRFKTVDIAVAVSVAAGLITPIIRHADYKNVGEISVEIHNLAARAKEGKLQPEEYKGGSFTLSNLGMYGVSHFQAILNPPQAALLAVGGIREIPVVRNGSIVPGKVMTVTLSADHRVVDGALGAQFLKTLQKFIENPALLVI